MFDGKTLDGWVPRKETGEAVNADACSWKVKDGCIYCSGELDKYEDYWIASEQTYDNFIFHLEYKMLEQGCNSGVFLRSPGLDTPWASGFEVQILDEHGVDPNKWRNGSIYDVLTPMLNTVHPVGEWNEMDITCCGLRVIVACNGIKILDADFSQLTEIIGKYDFPYCQMPASGYIGLQNHGNKLMFRNLRIMELKGTCPMKCCSHCPQASTTRRAVSASN
jgi:hypothetical protein